MFKLRSRYVLYSAAIVLMLTGNCFGQETRSVPTDTSDEFCNSLKDRGSRNYESSLYKRSYDTLKLYIESCAHQYGSFHQFTLISGSAQYMSDDNSRWLEFRAWLLKVLYLNMDTLYYCGDVSSLLGTFQYLRPGQGQDYNGEIAVIDYLLRNNRCPDDSASLMSTRKYFRDGQLFIWRDTVKDSIKTPIDTSLPNIDDLGLSILRGQNKVAGSAASGANRLANFIAERNPFTDEVILKVELNAPAMLRLEIFDELGRQMYADGLGFRQSGISRYFVSANLWPSGVYYARLSTPGGEVRTVKLVKQ